MTSDSGHELRENNEKIVKLMSQLKKSRNEMNYLIEKQELEKERISNEIEKLSFKLTLLTKSLSQRIKARIDYDKTIKEIEENYSNLVEESGKLLFSINKEVNQLEQIMDKKIGTATENSHTAKKAERDNSNMSMSDVEDNASETSSNKIEQKSTEGDSEEETEGHTDLERSSSTLDGIIAKKPSKVIDDEVQSFRDAYNKQHRDQVPARHPNKRMMRPKSDNP